MIVEQLLENTSITSIAQLLGKVCSTEVAIIPPSYNAQDHTDALRYILKMIDQHGPDINIVYSWQSEGYLIDVMHLMNKLGKILVTEHNISIDKFVYICAAAPVDANFEYYKTYKKMFPYIPNVVYFETVWELQNSAFLPDEPEPPNHSLDPARNKSFMFLNRGARPHRVIALSELYTRGLLDKCYLSFYDSSIPDNAIRVLTPKLATTVIDNHYNFLADMLPIKLTLTDDYYNMYRLTAEDISLHQNSLFSLISETLFCSNIDTILESDSLLADALCFPCILLSEKTWRTIKQKHPFIILGVPGSLKALREMGYKTFSPYIDESYDEIQNDEERLIAVINEVERLCNMSDEETRVWLEGVHEITKYNFERNTKRKRYVDKFQVKS